MRKTIFLVLFIFGCPFAARAQTEQQIQPLDAQTEALSQTIIDLTDQVVTLRTELIQSQNEVAELQSVQKNKSSKVKQK
ncbi:MAG: hypothetical protein KGI54_14275 [Pseudomonadota bacterium]|nr:hypothetical protein [Pseudomonadota bacterium]